jgi:hypothetical protein
MLTRIESTFGHNLTLKKTSTLCDGANRGHFRHHNWVSHFFCFILLWWHLANTGLVLWYKNKNDASIFTLCTTLSAKGITRIGLVLHRPLIPTQTWREKKKKKLYHHLSWTKKTFDFQITSHHGPCKGLCDNVSWMFGSNIILGVILFLVYCSYNVIIHELV